MDEINEMIADAIAEEEVAKANGYSIPKTKKDDTTTKVTVDLEEYVLLRRIKEEHLKLLTIIEDSLELSKYDKSLSLRNYEDVVSFFRFNYPDAYYSREEELKKLQDNEDE